LLRLSLVVARHHVVVADVIQRHYAIGHDW
jgi:hypothetical protein